MTTRLAQYTGSVLILVGTMACSTQPAEPHANSLTFVIDELSNDQWSHFEDGSFEVLQTVTARVTTPTDLRGRIVKVQINPLAEFDREVTIGSQWSAELPEDLPDDDQLQWLVQRRITRQSNNE